MATQEGLKASSREHQARQDELARWKTGIKFQCPVCDHTEFTVTLEKVTRYLDGFNKLSNAEVKVFQCAGCSVVFKDPAKFSKIK